LATIKADVDLLNYMKLMTLRINLQYLNKSYQVNNIQNCEPVPATNLKSTGGFLGRHVIF